MSTWLVLSDDSTVIIDALELRYPERPMVPTTPVQRALAHLLGGFGSEGMLSIAMHYRWSYRAEQEHFLRAEFGRAADAIPETLEPVIRLMFQDWGAQLLADARFTNEWLAANPDAAKGQPASNEDEPKEHPTLGEISYAWRGVTVKRGSAPQGLWHFERGARLARELEGGAKERFDALVQRCGGSEVMKIRLDRPIERQEGLLVLA